VDQVEHRVIDTNGIKMHLAEKGHGPLVVLCHGFPESWYSWRHQLSALAAGGYHAVAPDQRGYGRTDRPEPIEAYTCLQLAADIVGLVQALSERTAVIVGHDWGAPVAFYSALLRPDMFTAVGLLSVPYLPRQNTSPAQLLDLMAGEDEFYQRYFQEPGKAERELEEDVPKTIRRALYSASGDAPANMNWAYKFPKGTRFIDAMMDPRQLPSWLTEKDIGFFVSEFERTGFRGGLNWYRNIQRNWELTPFLTGALLRQPSLLVYGDRDVVYAMYPQAFDAVHQTMPGLRKAVVLPGVGHWTQQERPEAVNQALLEFLGSLS
jgi:pimeloyl-ACP methyl ester carboxylesterase